MRGREIVLDHKKIIDLYESGMLIADIATQMNCSTSSVIRVVNTYNSELRRRPNNTSSKGLNTNFFDKIDYTNQIYFDLIKQYGSIQSSKNLLSVSVPIAMIRNLEDFREAIGIREKKIYVSSKRAQLQVASRPLVESIKKALGYT